MRQETSTSGTAPTRSDAHEKDVEAPATTRNADGQDDGDDSSIESKQAGVRKAEILRKYISKRALTVAYIALVHTMPWLHLLNDPI